MPYPSPKKASRSLMYSKMPGKIKSMEGIRKKPITPPKTAMISISMKSLIIKDSVPSVLSANKWILIPLPKYQKMHNLLQ